MTEKTKERIKKLQALAERGIGGEKTTATEKLQKLLEANGITSLDELETEEAQYCLFSYNGRHEIKLLKQIIYKVVGNNENGTEFYRTTGKRQKIGAYCTPTQKIEIELDFEFYRNAFYEELSSLMDAFIQKQRLFPDDAPIKCADELTDKERKQLLKMSIYMDGMEKVQRRMMIEQRSEE